MGPGRRGDAPSRKFDEFVRERAEARAAPSDRPDRGPASCCRLAAARSATTPIEYGHVEPSSTAACGAARITIAGARLVHHQPRSPTIVAAGDRSGRCAVARELDDALLHLRFNEPELGTWVLRTEGDADRVLAADDAARASTRTTGSSARSASSGPAR